MRYFEALDEYSGGSEPSLFLAGGITGTFDWQADLVRKLSDLPITVLNPRRRNFPIDDRTAAAAQIDWEYRHLRLASAVLFWFPPETLCPIALFELGGRTMVPGRPLFVGTDSLYARRSDVIIQLKLARPEVEVTSDLGALTGQVRTWIAKSSR